MTGVDKKFPELHQALKSYFVAISLQKSISPPSLSDAIKDLDNVGDRYLEIVPPMLKHYLEKKSYEKALQFLEDAEKEG